MLTFATQEPFFATLLVLFLIYAVAGVVKAFINRNKPEVVECDCYCCDVDDEDEDDDDETNDDAINEEPF